MPYDWSTHRASSCPFVSVQLPWGLSECVRNKRHLLRHLKAPFHRGIPSQSAKPYNCYGSVEPFFPPFVFLLTVQALWETQFYSFKFQASDICCTVASSRKSENIFEILFFFFFLKHFSFGMCLEMYRQTDTWADIWHPGHWRYRHWGICIPHWLCKMRSLMQYSWKPSTVLVRGGVTESSIMLFHSTGFFLRDEIGPVAVHYLTPHGPIYLFIYYLVQNIPQGDTGFTNVASSQHPITAL